MDLEEEIIEELFDCSPPISLFLWFPPGPTPHPQTPHLCAPG